MRGLSREPVDGERSDLEAVEDFFSSADELVGPSLFLGLVSSTLTEMGECLSRWLWARNPQLLPAAGAPAPKKAAESNMKLGPDFNLP